MLVVGGVIPLVLVVAGDFPPYILHQWGDSPLHLWSNRNDPLTLQVFWIEVPPYIDVKWCGVPILCQCGRVQWCNDPVHCWLFL